MHKLWIILVALSTCGHFGTSAIPVKADIIVPSWALGVLAEGPSSNAAIFGIPQSPFIDQHAVSLSPPYDSSTAAAQYMIEYLAHYGSFHIASQQEATGLSTTTVRTMASGSIRLTVTEPLYLNINASWTYALPADFMMTQMGVTVKASDSSDFLFIQDYQPGTMPGEPASGTLPIQGDVTLTPGHTWIMSYNLRLMTYPGTQGYSATGNGYVNFTITPEASSLALLAPALLCALARRRRAASP